MWESCQRLQQLLEVAATAGSCRASPARPQYDEKCSFYFNCSFFLTTPTNRDLRQKAVYFLMWSRTCTNASKIALSPVQNSKLSHKIGLYFFLNFFFKNIIVLTLKRPKNLQIFRNLQQLSSYSLYNIVVLSYFNITIHCHSLDAPRIQTIEVCSDFKKNGH